MRHRNLVRLDHPLIQHKLTHMRAASTPTALFRQLLREITLLLGFEATRDLPTEPRAITTPLASIEAPVLAGPQPAIVPILRAGLVMAEALMDLIPTARQGHIGLYRDEATHLPVEYVVRLPEAEDRLFIVTDPMLATGGSAAHAIDILNRHGVPDIRIRMMALVCAPEGLDELERRHPAVTVYAAALDERLDERAFIVPGLGDAGDRLFGT